MATRAGRAAWVPEDLYPFESRYRHVGGARVHYIDEGDGPPLLFLHGNPTWSFVYRNLVLALRDSFRCVAVDYPGFGLSSAPEGYAYTAEAHAAVVEELVEELDLQDVSLMGQDWGGPIGLTVACRHPERYSRLILGNTWAWPLNGIPHFELFARVMGSGFARPLIRNANLFVNAMIPLGTKTNLHQEVMDAYRGPFATADARLATWELPRELLRSQPFLQTLADELPKLAHLPTLFVWGGADFALRSRVELPRFERLFPDHETVVLEGAGHFFQEDAPEEAAKAIRRWMTERAPG